MLLNNTWDIRVNLELRAYFDTLRKKGSYYWKLSNDEAIDLIRILCASYNVRMLPSFSTTNTAELKARSACGLCSWRDGRGGAISTYPRPHFKTVAHEVYHHIDFYYRYGLRRPTYNSSDAKNHAWNFAERLWKALTAMPVAPKPCVVPKVVAAPSEPAAGPPKRTVTIKLNAHTEVYDTLDTLKAAFISLGGAKGWRAPSKPTALATVQGLTLPLDEGKTCSRKVFALDNGTYALAWVTRT